MYNSEFLYNLGTEMTHITSPSPPSKLAISPHLSSSCLNRPHKKTSQTEKKNLK